MFLQKMESTTAHLCAQKEQIEELKIAALKYGMRIDKTPTRLKHALKKLGFDSKESYNQWRYDYYLLFQLPAHLVTATESSEAFKKSNSPKSAVSERELARDIKFAGQLLNAEDMGKLKIRFETLPPISAEEVIRELIPHIKNQVERCFFVRKNDAMYNSHDDNSFLTIEKFSDSEQDIVRELVYVYYRYLLVAKPGATREDCLKYCSSGLNNAVNTYLTSMNYCGRSRMKDSKNIYETYNKLKTKYAQTKDVKLKSEIKVMLEGVKTQFKDAEFVSVVVPLDRPPQGDNPPGRRSGGGDWILGKEAFKKHELSSHAHEGYAPESHPEVELLHDLRKILTRRKFQFVSYLLGHPDTKMAAEFELSLGARGIEINEMQPSRVIKHLEQFLGVSMVALKEDRRLQTYFRR